MRFLIHIQKWFIRGSKLFEQLPSSWTQLFIHIFLILFVLGQFYCVFRLQLRTNTVWARVCTFVLGRCKGIRYTYRTMGTGCNSSSKQQNDMNQKRYITVYGDTITKYDTNKRAIDTNIFHFCPQTQCQLRAHFWRKSMIQIKLDATR